MHKENLPRKKEEKRNIKFLKNRLLDSSAFSSIITQPEDKINDHEHQKMVFSFVPAWESYTLKLDTQIYTLPVLLGMGIE